MSPSISAFQGTICVSRIGSPFPQAWLVKLEITKGEHLCCASPVFTVSGPLGTQRSDGRFIHIPDTSDLGHINPIEGDTREGKAPEEKKGGFGEGGGEGKG